MLSKGEPSRQPCMTLLKRQTRKEPREEKDQAWPWSTELSELQLRKERYRTRKETRAVALQSANLVLTFTEITEQMGLTHRPSSILDFKILTAKVTTNNGSLPNTAFLHQSLQNERAKGTTQKSMHLNMKKGKSKTHPRIKERSISSRKSQAAPHTLPGGPLLFPPQLFLCPSVFLHVKMGKSNTTLTGLLNEANNITIKTAFQMWLLSLQYRMETKSVPHTGLKLQIKM